MKIILFAQKHAVDLPGINFKTSRIDEFINRARVTISQFNIAKLLGKIADQNYPVLLEGVWNNTSLETILQESSDMPEIVSKVQDVFAQGIPEHYQSLNTKQKELLYQGGPLILLILQKISVIYPTAPAEQQEEITKASVQEYSSLTEEDFTNLTAEEFVKKCPTVYGVRERAAITCAKKAALEQYGSHEHATVILIYGHHHANNLKRLCAEEGIELEQIDTLTKIELDTSPLEEESLDADLFQDVLKGMAKLNAAMLKAIFVQESSQFDNIFGLREHLQKAGVNSFDTGTHVSDLDLVCHGLTDFISNLSKFFAPELSPQNPHYRNSSSPFSNDFLTLLGHRMNAERDENETSTTESTIDNLPLHGSTDEKDEIETTRTYHK